ncbi:hypothetical protein [Aliikangiella coralliicola]|uniref:Uncharacterized protein n=1 Tax=Aliikangiella coralliicola TaxID=2592383 RepID=A0A545UH05_9GAMM|nr:hypothetical protein [Aliikangiella coralliicola]TQV88745.1 hypothetical protein FLL46_04225 [Aliikangiella coralliicola]
MVKKKSPAKATEYSEKDFKAFKQKLEKLDRDLVSCRKAAQNVLGEMDTDLRAHLDKIGVSKKHQKSILAITARGSKRVDQVYLDGIQLQETLEELLEILK